jgi:hypothetical protein
VVHRPADLARGVAYRFGQHRVVFYQQQVHRSTFSVVVVVVAAVPAPLVPGRLSCPRLIKQLLKTKNGSAGAGYFGAWAPRVPQRRQSGHRGACTPLTPDS